MLLNLNKIALTLIAEQNHREGYVGLIQFGTYGKFDNAWSAPLNNIAGRHITVTVSTQ